MPFLSNPLQAQFEVGVMGGVATYTGDMSRQNTWFSTADWNASFGGFVRYTFHRFVAAKLGLTYGTLSGSDSKSTDGIRLRRDQNFRTPIYEFSLVGEFNILGYQPYNLVRPFSPYIFAGVAGFVFNPQGELDGQLYDLQPLGTEGQGLNGNPAPYGLTQIAIPLGIGVKYAINDQWNLGIEFGARKTFTDYLDDISTTYASDEALINSRGEIAQALANRTGIVKTGGEVRGSDKFDDSYFIGGISISFNFTDNGLVGSRSRRKGGKKGCPGNF